MMKRRKRHIFWVVGFGETTKVERNLREEGFVNGWLVVVGHILGD